MLAYKTQKCFSSQVFYLFTRGICLNLNLRINLKKSVTDHPIIRFLVILHCCGYGDR